jgi:hypothetical protein
MPLFGRNNSQLTRKLETPNVYLGPDYILAMDLAKSIYMHKMYSG